MTDKNAKLKNLEERQIVLQALKGSELAWKQILVRYRGTMQNAIRGHLHKFKEAFDAFKAEDIFQEVLLKLHKGALEQFLDSSSSESSLSSFLYVVSQNTAKDFTKSKLGQANLVEINPDISDSDSDDTISLMDLVLVEDKTPLSEVLDLETRKQLLSEILALPPDKQEIIKLFLTGEANKDIAKTLGKTPAYVNKCIFNFKNFLESKYSKAEGL